VASGGHLQDRQCADEKRRFVREIADTLLCERSRSSATSASEQRHQAKGEGPSEGEASDDDAGGLLDLCFDRGILPSYAFPTDLC
jgi:hypothetical protein